MDKIDKFLRLLTKEERGYLLRVIAPGILALNLTNLEVKKIVGMPLWRVKYKNIRIIFAKFKNKGVIMRVSFRKDAYKNLGDMIKRLKG